nr:unnamed protein product [Callosobruchus analis]
MTAMTSEENL